MFNVLMTFFLLGQKTSLSAIVCCAVIVIGFYLGVDQEDASGELNIQNDCGVKYPLQITMSVCTTHFAGKLSLGAFV